MGFVVTGVHVKNNSIDEWLAYNLETREQCTLDANEIYNEGVQKLWDAEQDRMIIERGDGYYNYGVGYTYGIGVSDIVLSEISVLVGFYGDDDCIVLNWMTNKVEKIDRVSAFCSLGATVISPVLMTIGHNKESNDMIIGGYEDVKGFMHLVNNNFTASVFKVPNNIKYLGALKINGLKKLIVPGSVVAVGVACSRIEETKGIEGLTEVIIEEGTRAIIYEAFKELEYLEKVKLPSTLEYICASAFEGCTSLKKADLPEALKLIGHSAFKDNRSLESIHIPEKVIGIRELTFKGCKSLVEVTLSDNVLFIDDSAFYECAFDSIKLPKKLKRIESFAFSTNKELKSIDIPNEVNEINHYAFSNCSSLERVHVGSSLKKLEDGIFSGCESLKHVSADKVEIVGTNAFNECTSLEEIRLPRVTHIGNSAFKNCEELKRVYIPNIESISKNAFENCTSLEEMIVSGDIKINSIELGIYHPIKIKRR